MRHAKEELIKLKGSYVILGYPKRSNFCHEEIAKGITEMIKGGDEEELSEVDDKGMVESDSH